MIVICPHSIGRQNTVRCIDGCINGMRCPNYQRSGQQVTTDRLLDVPVILNSELCGYITEVMRDYAVIGQYTWACTEWPIVSSGTIECQLISNTGERHTIKQVVEIYKDSKVEVIQNDGERKEEIEQHTTNIYN